MGNHTATAPAAAAGTITLGGELTVHRMGFGAMRLTGEGIWGPPEDREQAKRVLHEALELGVDFLDTADSYGPHVNEELIAEALHPYPAGLVIATKGGTWRPGPGKWARNGRPEHLRDALEGSLRRLRLERVDLYQLHAPDPEVPIEDSLEMLAGLQQQGKIRHIGVSNFDVPQLERAIEVVEIVSVQNQYNLDDRRSEDVLRWCDAEGVAFIPWQPIKRGALEGRALERIAREKDATPTQIALAWLLHRSPAMLPIPGTSRLEHLRQNVLAAEIELTEEEVRELGTHG